MKIGLISTYANQTPPLAYGGEVFFWGLAKTLADLGHEVHLFATGGSKTPPNGSLHYIRASANGMIDYGLEVWLERTYHDLLMSMDIVHDCSLDHIPAERLRGLYGKKGIVNTINGHTYYMPRPPFNVVTGSKWWQADAERHGLKTEMIYWGVDTAFYTPSEKNEREDWFLWLARFHPCKGLDVALDLCEYLGFKLKIAGSMQFTDHAHYGKQYLDRIDRLPNAEYVQLPMDSTHHKAKRELYRKAQAFLYPVQYDECFGLVVAEAMACGCPVITTPRGAMPEIVREGSGFLCGSKVDFTKAITDKIPQWNKNKAYHKGFNLNEGAREQALNFTWEQAAFKYEKLYEKVLEGYEWK